MKYIDYGSGGSADSLRLADTAVPVPAAGEILIEVHYAGVNGPDIVQRRGLYPPPPDASPILGLEVSGRVASLGEGVAAWQVGDMVTALVPGGGYAEFCTVPAEHVLPIPVGMSLVDAAGLTEVWFTAWANLVHLGKLKPKENVLIHGGAGGVGLAAIQVAKLIGAEVFTTEGGEAKLAVCAEFGAQNVIDYQTADFYEVIRAKLGRRGLDVVLDIIGGSYFQKNLNLLTRDGRLVLLAFNQGSKVEFDFVNVLTRRLTITGSTMRARSNSEKAAIRNELLERVWPKFADGSVRTHTHAVLPLADAAEAHRLMESAKHIGKIILAVK